MKRIIFLFATLFCCIAHAQTETTNWYIEGQLYDTTTCESGNDVTMPTTPEKFGYTFQGWMPAVYDMSTLDYTLTPTDTSACDNFNNQCTLIFSYGTIYFNMVSAAQNDTSERLPEERPTGTGKNCWIQIRSFKPTDSDIIYEPLQQPWIFCNNDSGSASSTTNRCASGCRGKITNATNGAAFRKKLFGID